MLLPLWLHAAALWRHAVWIHIVTSHNAWMGNEYSLQNLSHPRAIQKHNPHPSKQWDVCDNSSPHSYNASFHVMIWVEDSWWVIDRQTIGCIGPDVPWESTVILQIKAVCRGWFGRITFSVLCSFVRVNHRWLINSPHKGTIVWTLFPYHLYCLWMKLYP